MASKPAPYFVPLKLDPSQRDSSMTGYWTMPANSPEPVMQRFVRAMRSPASFDRPVVFDASTVWLDFMGITKPKQDPTRSYRAYLRDLYGEMRPDHFMTWNYGLLVSLFAFVIVLAVAMT